MSTKKRRTHPLAGLPKKERGENLIRISPQSTPVQESRFVTIGLVAQRTQLPSSRRLEYEWCGASHYLALHDLHREDGETFCDDQRPSTLRDLRGTMTFIPAGGRAWGWSQTNGGPQGFTALYLNPSQIEPELGQRLNTVQLRTQLYFSHVNLRGLLRRVEHALGRDVTPDRLYLEHLCLLSMVELCRIQESKQGMGAVGALSPAQERRVRDYIEAQLDQDIGLEELAQVAGYSRFHFLRAFKQATGQTPYQYLLQRRIERACIGLKAGEAIEQVAASIGFKSPIQFARAFRRITGITPRQFAG